MRIKDRDFYNLTFSLLKKGWCVAWLTRNKHFFIVCMLFIVWFSASVSLSQEAEQKYTATTISDPQIPVGDLELLLKPLTKSELIVEAEAWLQLLKSKVSQIS